MITDLRPFVVLGVLALLGVSCAAGSDDATTTTTERDRAVAFAECMRENGIAGFPDPDASGELTIDGVANGSAVDVSSPAFEHAIAACEDLEPSGFTGQERTAEQQSAALEFARCIREHGVEDFPDPAEDAPLVDTNLIPSTDREGGMATLNAAMDACGQEAERAMAERG